MWEAPIKNYTETMMYRSQKYLDLYFQPLSQNVEWKVVFKSNFEVIIELFHERIFEIGKQHEELL